MALVGRKKKIKDPVEATAQVVGVSAPPHHAVYSNCAMQLVVHVPGTAAYPVQITRVARVSKWPHPGQVLPVTVSRTQPDRVNVEWDRVPKRNEIAADQAAVMAAALNQRRPPPHGTTTPAGGTPGHGSDARAVAGATSGVGEVTIGGRAATDAERRQILGLVGDLLGTTGTPTAGDGAPTPPTSFPPPRMSRVAPSAPAPGDDRRLGELERLAGLWRSGVLTDEEFEREKRRLLDG